MSSSMPQPGDPPGTAPVQRDRTARYRPHPWGRDRWPDCACAHCAQTREPPSDEPPPGP